MGATSEEGSKKLEKFKTRAQNYNPKPFRTDRNNSKSLTHL